MQDNKYRTQFNPRKIPPKIIGSPCKYIQGAGAIGLLGQILSDFGEKPLIISDDIVWSILGERITINLSKLNTTPLVSRFGGECSHSEIDRINTMCRNSGCDVIVGVGGGKTLDTAKAISLQASLPLVIVPSIASTDAPISRLIVIYSEKGALLEVQLMPFNPNVILVDTEVIANAPVRFFIAGMGDALTTKFEAEQNAMTGSFNFFNGRQTHTSLVLADTCYKLIRQYGCLAKRAVELKIVTEALELVVEANILLSGLGFESGGLSAAHALTRGFSQTKEMHGSLHGEEVAFGLLVQFVLENRSYDFVADMIKFYRSIGLPCTLADLGLITVSDRHLKVIAKYSCADDSHIYKMTIHIDERSVIDAILFADALGQEKKDNDKFCRSKHNNGQSGI